MTDRSVPWWQQGVVERLPLMGFHLESETSSERGFSVPWLTSRTPGAAVDPQGSSDDELC